MVEADTRGPERGSDLPKATQHDSHYSIGLRCSTHSSFRRTCLSRRRQRLTGTCQRPESQPPPAGTEVQPGEPAALSVSSRPGKLAPGGRPCDPFAPVPILRRLLLGCFVPALAQGFVLLDSIFTPDSWAWALRSRAPACREDQSTQGPDRAGGPRNWSHALGA